MLKKTTIGLYQSTLFEQVNVRHGVSSRSLGDARDTDVRNRILSLARLDPHAFVGVVQVHGSEVAILTDTNKPGVSDSDASVTNIPGRVIGVRTADCVPVLLADPTNRVIGIAHAGWRGTLGGITKNTIHSMLALGATVENIFSCIGPHIGACCYVVNETRAKAFEGSYQDNEGWHVDLGALNRKQLIQVGIAPDHIDSPITCTSCESDRFYSYRKDTKETFGEMLSFIAIV